MVHTDIFFCGIKHSGKSTLGKLCARHLGLSWKDADHLLQSSLPKGETIRSFYREKGAEAFRQKEVGAMCKFLASPHTQTIVSMGGGACDNDMLMLMIMQKGLCLYLKVKEEVLFERIAKDGIPPFLDADHPRESFHALYQRRDGIYSRLCTLVIDLPDTPDVEDSVRYVEKKLQGARHGAQHIRL